MKKENKEQIREERLRADFAEKFGYESLTPEMLYGKEIEEIVLWCLSHLESEVVRAAEEERERLRGDIEKMIHKVTPDEMKRYAPTYLEEIGIRNETLYNVLALLSPESGDLPVKE